MAAAALGMPSFTIGDLVAELRWPARTTVGVVESAGGVRSPQASDGDAVELGRQLRPGIIVVVADAGLGTINAVRMTMDVLTDLFRPDRSLDRALVGSRAEASGSASDGPSDRVGALVVLNRFDPASDLHRRNRAWLAAELPWPVLVAPDEVEDLADRVLRPPP
jgi:dethiobiotin synthetase